MTELGIQEDAFKPPQSENMKRIMNAVLNVRYPDICISGPLGTSKTTTAIWLLHYLCCICNDLRAVIVRNEKSTLQSTVIQTIKDMMIYGLTKHPAAPFEPYGGDKRPSELNYKSGSTLFFGGTDEISKVLGLECQIIFYNQADRAKPTDYADLNARLRGRKGGFTNPFTGRKDTLFLTDANPRGPRHFLLKRAEQGLTKMFHTTLRDNPGYFWNGDWTQEGFDYKQRLENSYPDNDYRRKRFIDGIWAGPENLVYPMWNEDIHVCRMNRHDIPKNWRWSFAADYGTQHSAVILLCATSPDRKKTWVFKEFHRVGKTSNELVPVIRNMMQKYDVPRNARVVGDTAGEGNLVLKKAGLNVLDANKKVLFGVDCVKAYMGGANDRELRVNEDLLDHPPDPQLVAKHHPANLIEELSEYESLPEERQTTGTYRDELPAKYRGRDDACDALRYFITSIWRQGFYVPGLIATTTPRPAASWFD